MVKIEGKFYVLMQFIAYWTLILELSIFLIMASKTKLYRHFHLNELFSTLNYDPDPILSKTLSLQLI